MYIYPDPISTPETPDVPRKSLLSIADCSIGPAQRVKLLSRVAAFYHRTFMERAEGVRYLTEVRGIRKASLFKTFHVGLANGTLLDLRLWRYPGDNAEEKLLRAFFDRFRIPD
jgi:hypothetical protein